MNTTRWPRALGRGAGVAATGAALSFVVVAAGSGGRLPWRPVLASANTAMTCFALALAAFSSGLCATGVLARIRQGRHAGGSGTAIVVGLLGIVLGAAVAALGVVVDASAANRG